MKLRKVIKCILIILITIICLFSMNILLKAEQKENKKTNITQLDMSYSRNEDYNPIKEIEENKNVIENQNESQNGNQNENQSEGQSIMTITNEYVGNTQETEYIENKEKVDVQEEEEIQMKYTNGIIGTLKIPKLNLEAEIKEGIDEETLASYIGHFTNSALWDGNVALAAHNRGSTVKHYFEGIHLLEEGDEIIYTTNMGERRYKVENQKEISNTDWSVTLETAKNMLTMITCITGYPEKRLCVQAKAF